MSTLGDFNDDSDYDGDDNYDGDAYDYDQDYECWVYLANFT